MNLLQIQILICYMLHVYRLYEGEGHGFRKAEMLADYYQTTKRFLSEQVILGGERAWPAPPPAYSPCVTSNITTASFAPIVTEMLSPLLSSPLIMPITV